MGNLDYYVRRGLKTVALIFAVSTFLFFGFHLMPGDYTTALTGPGTSPEEIAEVERQMGTG